MYLIFSSKYTPLKETIYTPPPPFDPKYTSNLDNDSVDFKMKRSAYVLNR